MPVTAGLVVGGLQSVYGAAQQIGGNRRLKRLAARRQARETPQEYLDANNLALNEAQTGYGASALNYFTKQTDRALATSLETASRMGGDPMAIADIFDRQMQSIMKTTNDDALMKYQKTSRVFDSIIGLGEQRLANWADKEAVLKDKMASEAMKVQAGSQTMNSGLNLAMSSLTAMDAGKGYDQKALTGEQSVSGRRTVAPAELLRTERQPLPTSLRGRNSPNVNTFIGPVDWWSEYLNN